MNSLWKVVIVGGRFGGLRAAQNLKADLVDITLVDRRNYHCFQPRLYEVTTGSLAPGKIFSPLRGIVSRRKNTRVLLGTVENVDRDSKVVYLADGAILPYDSLIVAGGSQTPHFGRSEWQEWAPGLKSFEEAITTRHKILYPFEGAERILDPEQRRAWRTVVIVGAGPTGGELAGAIAEIAKQTLKNDFRSMQPEKAALLGAPLVPTPFLERLAKTRSLGRLGEDELTIKSGERTNFVVANTVIRAGGITAPPLSTILAIRAKAETDKGGRIKVQPDLSVLNHSGICVVGDLSSATDEHGKALPALAQVAMQGGACAVRSILRKVEGQPPLPPFRYFDKGSLAVIGRATAVANVFGIIRVQINSLTNFST